MEILDWKDKEPIIFRRVHGHDIRILFRISTLTVVRSRCHFPQRTLEIRLRTLHLHPEELLRSRVPRTEVEGKSPVGNEKRFNAVLLEPRVKE